MDGSYIGRGGVVRRVRTGFRSWHSWKSNGVVGEERVVGRVGDGIESMGAVENR